VIEGEREGWQRPTSRGVGMAGVKEKEAMKARKLALVHFIKRNQEQHLSKGSNPTYDERFISECGSYG